MVLLWTELRKLEKHSVDVFINLCYYYITNYLSGKNALKSNIVPKKIV